MYPETDDIKRLNGLKQVLVGKTQARALPYTFENLRLQTTSKNDFVLVQFAEIRRREAGRAERV